jgi:uncharacterized membrane protein
MTGLFSGAANASVIQANLMATLINFIVFFGVIFGIVPWAFIVLPALLLEPMFIAAYGIGLTCIFLMLLILKHFAKRTEFGNKILGEIRGFKTFLKVAEKSKLEMLVMENPTYFYDILPYAYVLGVSDKWINKFETIAMQAPDWYAGSGTFSTASFGTFMNSAVQYTSTAMSSIPSSYSVGSSRGSSSSGGSSGGGSSGGGSGGGGGGSW